MIPPSSGGLKRSPQGCAWRSSPTSGGPPPALDWLADTDVLDREDHPSAPVHPLPEPLYRLALRATAALDGALQPDGSGGGKARI